MSTHYLPEASPCQQPAKKLRSCLSPSRNSRSVSPTRSLTPRASTTPSDSSMWYRQRKCVRWEGEIGGSDVTCYFATYSATEYDRTPLAPPSEAERACVLPARGSRCLNFDSMDDDEEDEEEAFSDSETRLPPSPFATPEDSEEEGDRDAGDEWSDCFARRRMMFARLCPTREGPEFEGYRSLSATLVDLLRSVEDDDEERIASREESENELEDSDSDDDADRTSSTPISAGGFPVTSIPPAVMTADLFFRFREDSADSDIGTPSLVSSADSDDGSRLASPRGSAIEFVPGAIPPWKQPTTIPPAMQGTYIHVEL